MFPHTITYTRNRNAYIRVSPEGTVLFTIPQRCKHNEKFVQKLMEKGEKMWIRHQARPKVEKWNEEGVMLFGEWVSWEETGGLQTMVPSIGKISKDSRRFEKKLKEILYEYSKEWLDIFSEKLGKKYQSLTIRKAKSRRGSCSHDQKIMLNLALVYLPRTHIQYVIAHETAHLVEKNHSSDFWELVKKLFPDYQAVRKSLKNMVLD
ncbi:MAG: M48 family metallopeptidase [Candidatus Peribacteria bacterium]|jgi:predicted metal-dependent hydrolase|nr:M48 family metallopeptidase [Candidatus Peribacteria bacterium]